ncbi:MAG: TetR family transcriptional regulator [Actinomycetota bacterium]|nr:TetR family transcriptional regulator [Actinomycetota bacterium]
MTTNGRKLTPRGKERRQQLLDHATQRFAETGYHPTSVADIVGGVGVGKGVFYWYFDSKEQLFLELLAEAQRDLRRTQRDAIASEDDPLRRLEIGIRAAFRWWAGHPEIMNLLQFAATEKQFRPALRQGQSVALGDAVTHLKEAIAEGRITEELAHAIIGLTGHLSRELVHRRGDDPERVADLAVTLLFDGLRGR